MHSRLYTGVVTHKRLEPFVHKFRYGVFMSYLDLEEVDSILPDSWIYSSSHRALVEFRRTDYHGDPARPLAASIRDLVFERSGVMPGGPIRMLTNLRIIGHVFNPVTFYYCFDESGTSVEHIVTEITNTPWNERHAYILSPKMNLSKKADWFKYIIDKEFHVSPFMDLDYLYDMQFNLPGQDLFVSIANQRQEDKKFIATLRLSQKAFTKRNLLKQLLKFPFVTIKVVWGIYWQALILKIKGDTFYPHPGGLKSERIEENP
jgi:DUF1365 family protein